MKNIADNCEKLIQDNKLYDQPMFLPFILGNNEQQGKEAEEKYIKDQIKLIFQKTKLSIEEEGYIFKKCFDIKESAKPYRASLSKLESGKLYDASFIDGKLVINQKNTDELEKQKKALEKNESLKMVSGGFIANFIHNFKAAENLINIKLIDIDIKMGSNLKEVDSLLLNTLNQAKTTEAEPGIKQEENQSNIITEQNTETTGVELSSNDINIPNGDLTNIKPFIQNDDSEKSFKSFEKTLKEIYTNNPEISRLRTFKISKQSFDKFLNIGVNLSKVDDIILATLINGQTTSSIPVQQIGEGGSVVSKEISFKLDGPLDKPSIKIIPQNKKYINFNQKELNKTVAIKSSKAIKQVKKTSIKVA
jgi:hypothetical protein